jgi:AhpD family alkylhydroperoxidase
MEDVRILVDEQHPQAYRALKEVGKAVQEAASDAGLDALLVELVSVRVSQINGCAVCLDVHVRNALRAGESPQRIAVLSAWRDTALFSDRERAALALAESLTLLPEHAAQERDYAEARRHLTDEQLSAVSWITITMNAFNRLSVVSRHPVRPRGYPEGGPAVQG